ARSQHRADEAGRPQPTAGGSRGQGGGRHMRHLAWLAVLLLAGAGVGGCNALKGMGKKDNVEPPTPLTEFAPSATLNRLWSASVGGGAGKSGALVAPAAADGRVYAAGIDGGIAAIDAASGNTIWSQRLGGRTG